MQILYSCSFQEHVASHAPHKILEVDEFLALRKEIRHMLKHDVTTNDPASANSDAPPGEGEQDSVAVRNCTFIPFILKELICNAYSYVYF